MAEFGNKQKLQLAKDIIGGGKESNNEPEFDGERTGDIRIENAENGFIVQHDRRVSKPSKNKAADKGEGNNPVAASPDYEHTTHRRVFDANDEDGMLAHICAVLKSPKTKGSRY